MRNPFLGILLPEIYQVLFPASQKIFDKIKLHKEEENGMRMTQIK
jgi:hypothetical protein